MKKVFQKGIFEVATVVETVIGAFILVVVAVLAVRLVGEIGTSINFLEDNGSFNNFLAWTMNLVIGVEFVKMLCKHTPGTVIEVLLFATARQMIVEHLNAWEILAGAIAIALLFATRKFLFSSFDEIERTVYRGNQKVRVVNAVNHIHIPCEKDETLEHLVRRMLEENGDQIGTGACVYFQGHALRIAKIKDDVITRVELIQSGQHLD
ncbi:phosphate-starvation-inducible PsiE family protein [Diplocloster hominis]|uniref:phosphate-starvation-inducible PsiE family protein n=1 Tax=Diplocloster hominis TaxID=3079010 RepID=UPI0031BB6CAE